MDGGARASAPALEISHDDVTECVGLFARSASYTERWEELSRHDKDGIRVQIHREMRAGSDLYDLFAIGELPITAEMLQETNWDIDYRLKWDSYAKDIRVVETLHPTDARVHQDLTYWWCKAPWPLSDRDYVFYRHRTTRDNMHVLISKGIEGSSVPEVSGNVRVEQLRSFMAIRPHPEKDGHCEFAMLYFDDWKGSIPRTVVNWAVSKAIPAFLNSMVDAASKKNAPPPPAKEAKSGWW